MDCNLLTAVFNSWKCYRVWFKGGYATLKDVAPMQQLRDVLTPEEIASLDNIEALN